MVVFVSMYTYVFITINAIYVFIHMLHILNKGIPPSVLTTKTIKEYETMFKHLTSTLFFLNH